MPKLRERGGGPAVGVANDYTNFLRNMLWGAGGMGGSVGNAGASGIARALSGIKGNDGQSVMSGGGGGIAGIYGDLLGAGAGRVGGAYDELLQRDLESQRKGILTRFANIGGGQSSGAAQALARFNAEAAPRATLGIAGLQMDAIRPLLESLYGISRMGISQRQLVQEQTPIENIIGTAGQLAPVIGAFAGPAGIMAGGGINALLSGISGGKTPTPAGTDKLASGASLSDTGYTGTSGARFGGVPSFDAANIARSVLPQFGFSPN